MRENRYSHLTTEYIASVFKELYEQRPKQIVMYTGSEGMYSFNWALAHEAGTIPPTAGRTHAKLVQRIPNRRRAIDINNEVWGWEIANGKIWWTNLRSYRRPQPVTDPKQSRFNLWEQSLK